MKKPLTILCSLAAVAATLLSSCTSTDGVRPEDTTPSYVCVEANSGRLLYASNATEKRPIGMLANVATACVVMDWVKAADVNLDTQITVPQEATRWPKTNLLNLKAGETLSIRDALYSTIMWDDSASAMTLAYACGSAISKGDPAGAFVNQMNRLAARIGMNSTYFKGPSGAVVSQSTARDMALLGMYAVGNPALLGISSRAAESVTVNAPGGSRTQSVRNNNRLLSFSEQVDGLKAANSRSAGSCILATSSRQSVKRPHPETGQVATYAQRLIVVMLGMPDSATRNNNAAKFLRDGWDEWEQWLPTNDYADPSKFITLPN